MPPMNLDGLPARPGSVPGGDQPLAGLARRLHRDLHHMGRHREPDLPAADRLRKAHPNAIMIHTPVHASWLNQAEIFSIIQKRSSRPTTFASLDELSRTLLAFVNRYNATARPFNWKFTAADLADLFDRISAREQPAHEPAQLPEAA
jgi:hypothetical protein